MVKTVKVEDAVGSALAHDITEIRKGEFKGPAFRKGHVVRHEDICHLHRLGKRHLYVLQTSEAYWHENEAASMLAAAFCGPGVSWRGEPKEGKLKLEASLDGLLKVSVEALRSINLIGEIMCSTRHQNVLVDSGEVVAATRAIPLMIERSLVEEACDIGRRAGGLVKVLPLRKASVAVLITGSEVFNRLIEDQFEPILQEKIKNLGSTVLTVRFVPDDERVVREKIGECLDAGADLILTTGGMSVDPDDVTRLGIERAGGHDIVYGSPVLPGAMFMVAYIGDVPVLGVPACGIYHKITMLDLVLPRVLAGERFTRETIAEMGHGGLCLHCPECRFPACPFGR